MMRFAILSSKGSNKEVISMTDLTIGQRIAQERKKLNISQVGLATLMDVSRQAISKWEADAAIPEIDKLISLSKLFGVSIGWLLGVEDPAALREETLSEDHFRMVEELVKKYQAPPRPHLTIFHYLFAIGASLMIFLFLYGTTSRLEKQILMYEANIAGLEQRLEALEATPQTAGAPGQLLAGYSFDLYPLTKTKTTHRVNVSFSAVPHVWNDESVGYLCINSADGIAEPIQKTCIWNNGRLTAEVPLDVADGYELCFALEHRDGSREQQILEDTRIHHLGTECTIPIRIARGSYSYQDGTLVLKNFEVNFNLPRIYSDPTLIPNIDRCEYRLYRRPQNDSKLELIRADVTDRMEHSTMADYHYQVADRPVKFEDLSLENTNHFQLRFYVKLSSGVENEVPITILVPDGNGGLSE